MHNPWRPYKIHDSLGGHIGIDNRSPFDTTSFTALKTG
jgi:hypothetical protein